MEVATDHLPGGFVIQTRFGRAMLAVTAFTLLASGCSSTDRPAAAGDSDTSATSTTTASGAHMCTQRPSLDPVVSTPVSDAPHDRTVTSFDGTKIRVHWFPVDGASATKPAPTVLMGPGWSQPGETLEHESVILGALGIRPLNAAGYNVLTWDPRGFGKSEGTVEIDSAAFEGRDVQGLLDWVATQPDAQLDRPGDPRVAMIGASYGGGIQLTVAGIDCRVDALVPSLAWHSLESSMYKSQTMKAGWGTLLLNSAKTFAGRLDPHISSAADEGTAKVTISDEDEKWFRDRGPGELVDKIETPTLFVQGTVDTLFTLDEAIINYRSLRDRGVPTAMVWFCGGHGTCLSEPGDTQHVAEATFAWLDRYLKANKDASLASPLDLVDQHGDRWTGDDYPVTMQASLSAHGHGSLSLSADSVSGPATKRAGSTDVLSGLVPGITPAKATTALNLPIDGGSVDGLALGAPHLVVAYSGTSPEGTKATRVFAQLIDDDSGLVVGNQITPMAVTLDGKPHTGKLDLEVIAQHFSPGHTMTLQLVATTTAYATPRLGGTVAFDSIDIEIPVAKDIRKA